MTNKNHYQKHKKYFLDYYQKKKPSPRKFIFCVICGEENNNTKYVKVCSKGCSRTLRKITIMKNVREYLNKNKNLHSNK